MYFVFVLGVEGSLKREILAKDPTNSFKRTWNSMNSSLEAKGKTRSLPRIQLPADTSLFPNREHKPKQYHPTNNSSTIETKVDNHSNSPTKSMHCYFNISIAGSPPRRVVFRLYSDKCPMTCQNFITLCSSTATATKRRGPTTSHHNLDIEPTYRGTEFHRIIPTFMIQGGDFTNFDGTGGFAAPSTNHGHPTFPDENLQSCLSHNQMGILSMANKGKDTNGSQFFITLGKALHLDGKHVAFGKVIHGMEVIIAASQVETEDDGKGTPVRMQRVVIVDCGVGMGVDDEKSDDISSGDSKASSDDDEDSKSRPTSKSRRKSAKTKRSRRHSRRRHDAEDDGDDSTDSDDRSRHRSRSKHRHDVKTDDRRERKRRRKDRDDKHRRRRDNSPESTSSSVDERQHRHRHHRKQSSKSTRRKT